MLFDPEGPSARPVRYDVEAHPEPGLLCRLLAPLARRGLEPDALQSQRRGERMQCNIRFDAMPSEMIHLVEGNLRQVVGVVRVAVLVGASPREARAAA